MQKNKVFLTVNGWFTGERQELSVKLQLNYPLLYLLIVTYLLNFLPKSRLCADTTRENTNNFDYGQIKNFPNYIKNCNLRIPQHINFNMGGEIWSQTLIFRQYTISVSAIGSVQTATISIRSVCVYISLHGLITVTGNWIEDRVTPHPIIHCSITMTTLDKPPSVVGARFSCASCIGFAVQRMTVSCHICARIRHNCRLLLNICWPAHRRWPQTCCSVSWALAHELSLCHTRKFDHGLTYVDAHNLH